MVTAWSGEQMVREQIMVTRHLGLGQLRKDFTVNIHCIFKMASEGPLGFDLKAQTMQRLITS